ncbi:MAG TPA: TrkA family potassium uptake protein [Gemmatimonadales bacterium]
MRRFVIVGLGNFGSGIAEVLANDGHEVVAVDANPSNVDRIATVVERAVVGDGTRREVLERAGGVGADAAVVSVGDDITASILSVLALRDLKIPHIYAKVISVDHARVMERQGVTETIFPERDSAIALGRRLSSSVLLNYVRLGPGFSIQEMGVPDRWQGRTLRQLDLRQRYRVQVVAVHDMLRDEVIPVPDPDRVLTDSDTLFVSGDDSDLEKLARL